MGNKMKTEKYSNLKITTIVMLLTSVFFLTIGLTYAFYQNFLKGTTNNIIEAGHLSFYFDENSAEDGINIVNAYPIADSLGKRLSGEREYFDFSVHSLSSIYDIAYQVYVVKQPTSTLREEWVKVYLTLRNNNGEVASPLVMNGEKVKTFNELTGNNGAKLVYTGVAAKASEEYIQKFRLRLWIAEDVSLDETTMHEFENKSFSVKVKVTANQE